MVQVLKDYGQTARGCFQRATTLRRVLANDFCMGICRFALTLDEWFQNRDDVVLHGKLNLL